MKKRTVALLMAAVLLFGAAVGGTLAFLTSKTDTITNTFTAGNVAITLTETGATNNTQSFKMIPGTQISKDPTLTVEGGSEACYLYIKIEEGAQLDTYIEYSLATGWTQLDGKDDIWYREVAASAQAQAFGVLTNNKVTVKSSVTSDQMAAVSAGTAKVSLAFTGYAVQKDNAGTAIAAWNATFGKAP